MQLKQNSSNQLTVLFHLVIKIKKAAKPINNIANPNIYSIISNAIVMEFKIMLFIWQNLKHKGKMVRLLMKKEIDGLK